MIGGRNLGRDNRLERVSKLQTMSKVQTLAEQVSHEATLDIDLGSPRVHAFSPVSERFLISNLSSSVIINFYTACSTRGTLARSF